jgi:hypothetical protein
MEIRVDVVLPFPRERVFAAYRDRQAELLDFLPNIRTIKPISREDRDGEAHLVNEWTGGGDIPAAARSVLNESMLQWIDHATWRPASWVCAWRTEVRAFPGAFASSGTNRFLEAGGGTRIEFRGDLTCDATKIPGVPRLLAKTIGGTVEKLFVGKVTENLQAVGKGLEKLLRQTGG